MAHFLQYLLEYIVIVFTLGAVWHMVLFPAYYKKLAIYSRIGNPLFLFGFSSMLLQGIVLAYVYPLVGNAAVFGIGLFLAFVSFAVFTEVAKQNTTSLVGFVCIQTAFSFIQAILVTLAFWLIPLW